MLKKLHPANVTKEEKAFGIVHKKQTTGILLRNWLTYLLRQTIAEEEKIGFYTKKPNQQKVKQKFNDVVSSEIKLKAIRYRHENKLELFDKIMTHAEILCKKSEDGEYDIIQVFN